MGKEIRVLLGSTGIPHVRGGLESGYLDIYHGLKPYLQNCQLFLYTGDYSKEAESYPVWNVPRSSKLAPILGRLIRRPNPYVVEQLSSVLPVLRLIHKLKINVFMSSEVNLGMMLYRLRTCFGWNFRLLHSNVGPGNPPFVRTDHVHQITPFHLQLALGYGEPAEFHSLVPYGLTPLPIDFTNRQADQRAIRSKLNLPLDRPVAISVGWISKFHKRIDYIIQEFASLGENAPFLVLLGRVDPQSAELIELAARMLRGDNYIIRSVSPSEVFDYYRAADFFVHAALTEAFGRVFLEASMSGLPGIVHDFPVMRYVLEEGGTFVDMTRKGALAGAVHVQMKRPFDAILATRLRDHVQRRFSWEHLAPEYEAMFKRVAALPLRYGSFA